MPQPTFPNQPNQPGQQPEPQRMPQEAPIPLPPQKEEINPQA